MTEEGTIKENLWVEDNSDNWSKSIYTYSEGNAIKIENESNLSEYPYVALYTYDDKKAPFYYCETPKWLLQLELFNWV